MANKGFNPVQGEKNVRVKAVDLLDRCMEMLGTSSVQWGRVRLSGSKSALNQAIGTLAYDVNIFKVGAEVHDSIHPAERASFHKDKGFMFDTEWSASDNKRKSKKGDDWEPTDQDLYDK